MDLSTITAAQFKAFFTRDFPYPPTSATPSTDPCYVQDADINKAFLESQAVFNQGLFGNDATITLAYFYLTAHYLVNDLRTAQAGLESTGNYPVASRSVGSVSESYQIPDAYKDDPLLGFYTTTQYGQKYLSIVLPNLVGNMAGVAGATHP